MSDHRMPWIVIDAAHRGELRITHTTGGTGPGEIAEIKRYDAAALPTFTDALLRYEAETGIELGRTNSVLAIAGAATGENVSISRSRWTISRAGLTGIMGRPPLILNEVAARAWGATRSQADATPIRGSVTLDLTRPGQYAFMTVSDGVGGALIDIDHQGRVHIIESEVGHTDFAPADAEEVALAKSAAPLGIASWEQVLLASVTGMAPERRASLLGRFAANAALALGAWNGILLTGAQLNAFLAPNLIEPFDAAFRERRAFRRVMSEVGCWRFGHREAVIAGCLAVIAERERRV